MHEIRLATMADLESILAIFSEGQRYLQAQGLPQWQNGQAPGRVHAEEDIAKQEGYVLSVDGAVGGYAALAAGDDPCYAAITEPGWDETHDHYCSIHRVAVSGLLRGRGYGKIILDELVATARALGFQDVRIDTHPGNAIMQKAILRAGFTYRGTIRLPIENGERRAYQLVTA